MKDRSSKASGSISKFNVCRIAERIVSSELEFRGFRVSDLNKEGLAANADLLAVKGGKPRQIQVKGATNNKGSRWWVNYGFCLQCHIDNKKDPMFNRHTNGFYKADIVVLVAVRSPKDYRCIVLPVAAAERAAQMNLNGYFRSLGRNGKPRKPGRMKAFLVPGKGNKQYPWMQDERTFLLKHEDNWDFQLGR